MLFSLISTVLFFASDVAVRLNQLVIRHSIIFVFFLSFLLRVSSLLFFFFFNDTATTEIYTLSLHDALPILSGTDRFSSANVLRCAGHVPPLRAQEGAGAGEEAPTILGVLAQVALDQH